MYVAEWRPLHHMKNTYRNHKGEYTSKSEYMRRKEAQQMRRFKVFCAAVIFAFAFGFLSLSQNVQTPAAPETARAEEKIPDWDPCTLKDVVCEGEKDAIIQKAVQAVSEALGRDITDETRKRITYLYERATEHSVPFYDAVKTVYSESMWFNTQSGVVKGGVREPSYGLAQIHLPSHRLTKEKALDPYFAMDFLAENWNTTRWYGYDRATKSCTNGLRITLDN